MSLLVRKIDRSKWRLEGRNVEREHIPADALTNCMKTKQNRLSVWEIDSGDLIDEAALAIVASGQHIESIDLVALSREQLSQNRIGMSRSPGLTPVGDLKEKHMDLSDLTYGKLGVIAYQIAQVIVENRVKRYTKVHLKAILKDAVTNGRVDVDELDESIKKHLA